jgi:Na+-transporting NADH:ubiquinone oxidoreductase subunit NqrE
MINYLITVILLHVCAFLIYEFLLKKTTFLKGNRAYLLIVPLILWFIPFINIDALNQEPAIEETVYRTSSITEDFTENQVVFDAPETKVVLENQKESTFEFSWWWIYFLGAGISMIWFVVSFNRLRKIKVHATPQERNGIQFHRVSHSKMALSFMGSILIGDQIKEQHLEAILSHEHVHTYQKHHLDLVFFQLLNILMWFNPFNYLFLNRLKLTHELLADRAVAQRVGTNNYAHLLLKETFDTSDVLFANMFFSFKTIKTRIAMLHKKSSPKIAKMRYASLFVLLLTAVIYTSCTTTKEKELTLEQQISDLQETLKKTDSISFKDMEALEKLAISGYSFEEEEYAKIYKGKPYDHAAYINSPEGIAFQLKLDSIEDSKYEAEVEKRTEKRVNERISPQGTKRAQSMFYYKDKNGAMIKVGFLLPRSENCRLVAESKLKDCILMDLRNQLNNDMISTLKYRAKYTNYFNTITFIINENGQIDNIDFPGIMEWQDLEYDIVKWMGNYKDFIPATKNGKPIAINVQLTFFMDKKMTP